jgi:hypothetical protein
MSQSWIKAHTRALSSPQLLRLTWAQRGIWWSALLLSKHQSHVPGCFVDADDRPLPIDDIALALRARVKECRAAFRAFVAVGLMEHDATQGFVITGWEKWQSGTATEGRDAWRERKRRQRERERREQAKRRRPGLRVVSTEPPP